MEKDLYLKIGRPQNACVLCGTPIVMAGKHPSILLTPEEAKAETADARAAAPETANKSDDEDAPMRRDYCPACWEKTRDKDYFSFWIARREPPKPKKLKGRKERNAALLAYFHFVMAKNDPAYAPHLFFLAHMLMKFSVFKWVRSEPAVGPDGRERIVFRNTVADDMVTIESVTLEDEVIAQIKREIDEYICRNVESA